MKVAHSEEQSNSMRIVECVPNFSEGRRKNVVDAIANAIRSVPSITLLDVEYNVDHNRSVITFVGEPEAVKMAALAGAEKAVELIDLTNHRGEHPRMGAVDVVPFVPISGVTMDDCVKLAKEFGKEFSEKYHVPVFLYEEAASRPERQNLADVRSGEFEGLREEIGKNPEKKPDYGPDRVHPTAGATAVGAREVLIAYNVNLGTNDVSVAKKIAHRVRGRDGGLAYVKALGFELKERGIVQVSMNMTNYRKSQLFKAFELVKTLSEGLGVPVIGSEIVGLVPMDALVDSAEFYLALEKFSSEQVLEKKLFGPRPSNLIDQSLAIFSEEVASEKPTPGGGSVAAYMGALGASLLCMVSRITLRKKDRSAEAENLRDVVEKCEKLRERLLMLTVEDTEAFNRVMQALKIPKDRSEERKRAIQVATLKAAEVPLSTMEASLEMFRTAEKVAAYGTSNAMSDVLTAVGAGEAAIHGAASNVLINLASLDDRKAAESIAIRVSEIQREGTELVQRLVKTIKSRSPKM